MQKNTCWLNFMIIFKLIIFPKEKQKFSFLTSFSFLTCFRVEMDISHYFYKIRLKCEIFSPTFIREKGPILKCCFSIVYYAPRE